MSKKNAIPDAWDDDNYAEIVDDKQTLSGETAAAPPPKISKAEQKAKHEEANRRLWQSAENPDHTFDFVKAMDTVPLKSAPKQPLQIMSRRPKPPKVQGLGNAMQDMGLDDEDSEEERRKTQEKEAAERTKRAQLEREEKQRKYAEARERLFGSSSPTPDRSSSPGTGLSAPKSKNSRSNRRGGGGSRGRDSQHTSSGDVSPARGPHQGKQLYDPDYDVKPNPVHIQKSERPGGFSHPDQKERNKPIRDPKGPDGSGRGGFGFVGRGTKTNVR